MWRLHHLVCIYQYMDWVDLRNRIQGHLFGPQNKQTNTERKHQNKSEISRTGLEGFAYV